LSPISTRPSTITASTKKFRLRELWSRSSLQT
jgi:hypothetical protein